jgi:hypothetical protein
LINEQTIKRTSKQINKMESENGKLKWEMRNGQSESGSESEGKVKGKAK